MAIILFYKIEDLNGVAIGDRQVVMSISNGYGGGSSHPVWGFLLTKEESVGLVRRVGGDLKVLNEITK